MGVCLVLWICTTTSRCTCTARILESRVVCLVTRPDLDSLKRHGLPVILSVEVVEYFEWKSGI